jgi:hypothetical protein
MSIIYHKQKRSSRRPNEKLGIDKAMKLWYYEAASDKSTKPYTWQALRAGGRGKGGNMIIEAYKFDVNSLIDKIKNSLNLLGVGDELRLMIAPNVGGELEVVVLDNAALAFRYQDNEIALPWQTGTPQDVAKEAMSWMGMGE